MPSPLRLVLPRAGGLRAARGRTVAGYRVAFLIARPGLRVVRAGAGVLVPLGRRGEQPPPGRLRGRLPGLRGGRSGGDGPAAGGGDQPGPTASGRRRSWACSRPSWPRPAPAWIVLGVGPVYEFVLALGRARRFISVLARAGVRGAVSPVNVRHVAPGGAPGDGGLRRVWGCSRRPPPCWSGEATPWRCPAGQRLAALLSGVAYPVSVLPPWLQAWDGCFP